MRTTTLLALTLSLLLPASAGAQPADPQQTAAAKALYEQATAELDVKSYASACRKLEQVTQLAPDALGAKLTLGECYEALGKLASAFAQFTLVEEQAPKSKQPDRAKKAAAKAAALRPRLATVRLEVPLEVASVPGIAITCDGATVGEAQWRTPLPVDAGAHEIEATAPGRKAWKQQVEVTADGTAVAVAVASPAPVDRPVPVSRSASATAPTRAWQRPLGLTVMGVGAVGASVGAVLGGLAIVKNNKSNDGHCDAQSHCDLSGFNLRKEAVGFGRASTAAMVAGGVMLAGGIALFATAAPVKKGKERAARRESLRGTLKLSPGGLGVHGTW